MSVNAFPAGEQNLQGTQKALSHELRASKTNLEPSAGLVAEPPICPTVPDASEARPALGRTHHGSPSAAFT